MSQSSCSTRGFLFHCVRPQSRLCCGQHQQKGGWEAVKRGGDYPALLCHSDVLHSGQGPQHGGVGLREWGLKRAWGWLGAAAAVCRKRLRRGGVQPGKRWL